MVPLNETIDVELERQSMLDVIDGRTPDPESTLGQVNTLMWAIELCHFGTGVRPSLSQAWRTWRGYPE